MSSQTENDTTATNGTPGEAGPRRSRWRSLAGNTGLQVLFAAIAAAVYGLIWPDTGAELKPLADIFISLIRLVIPPIVFLVVVTGIVSVGGMKAVGRISLKAIIYFEVVTTVGTLLGLLSINFFHPGSGVAPPAGASGDLDSYVDGAEEKSISEFFVDMVPDNAVNAFATGHIIQILVFAILFSLALLSLPKEVSDPVLRACGKLSDVFFRMVRMVIRLAPSERSGRWPTRSGSTVLRPSTKAPCRSARPSATRSSTFRTWTAQSSQSSATPFATATPVVGYGFSSNGRYSVGEILRRRIIPRLLEAPPDSLLSADGSSIDPARAWAVMMRNEKPGGHGERSVAVGVIDMALFDLAAKLDEQPLYHWLSRHYELGQPDEEVFVYAAGGYYAPGKGRRQLQDEMKGFLDLGYHVVKMKIGGADLGDDIERIESVLSLLDGDGSRLAVDANGRFDLDTALRYARALQPYDLRWYEEPGDPLDFAQHAILAEQYPGALATGENLFSRVDAQNLIRYAGMRPDRDIIQIDPVLSYGLVEYLRIQDMLRQHGWSSRRCIPHGGHQFALHLSAALKLGGNESYPGEFQPTGGFADSAVIQNSRIRLTDTPGIGFEDKSKLHQTFLELHS